MQRVTIILAVVLVAQLALAGVLQLGASGPEVVSSTDRPFLAFDRKAIDKLRISGAKEGQQLIIERGADSWRLPGLDGFPAAGRSVERLLGDLESFNEPLPVARSESARERFRVGAESYERRVQLMSGDTVAATLYFGASAGTGSVYARAKGRDMIYEVQFPLWHASTDPAKWLDTSLAQVNPGDVVQAQLPGFTLRRADDGKSWRVLREGQSVETAHTGRAAKLVQRLARPAIESVSRVTAPEAGPALEYTLTTKDGEELHFRYYAGGDGRALFHRGSQPWRYTVKDKQLAQIEGAAPKTLVADKSAGSSSKPESGSGGEGAGTS